MPDTVGHSPNGFVTMGEEVDAMRFRFREKAESYGHETFESKGQWERALAVLIDAAIIAYAEEQIAEKWDETDTVDTFACKTHRQLMFDVEGVVLNRVENLIFGIAGSGHGSKDIAAVAPEWYYGVNKRFNLG